jgi:large subunit ribosomal protein L24e
MKCSFCGETAQKLPLMFVKNDGKIFNFCSSKCRSNWALGRDGKKVRWTKMFADTRASGAHATNNEAAAEKKEAAPKKKN